MLAVMLLLYKMNYLKNLMTRLGVSVDVVMTASVTLQVGIGYAWQICLLYNTLNKLISIQVLN